MNIHWKDWCWGWNSKSLATWCEEPTLWERPCCWKRLKPGGEGDDRGWDGWMASPTWWTCVWVSSKCWWWCAAVHGSQRAGHNWATELLLRYIVTHIFVSYNEIKCIKIVCALNNHLKITLALKKPLSLAIQSFSIICANLN